METLKKYIKYRKSDVKESFHVDFDFISCTDQAVQRAEVLTCILAAWHHASFLFFIFTTNTNSFTLTNT